MARAHDCTAQAQVDERPCLECLSKKELLAVLLYLLAKQNYDLPSEIDNLASDSACFRCLSDKQKLQGLVNAVYVYFGETDTVEEIRESVKCLICFGDADLKAMLAQQICEFLDGLTEIV